MAEAVVEKTGCLRKMKNHYRETDSVDYHLCFGDHEIALNARIGTRLRLRYTGRIRCLNCQKPTKKTFNQGFCWRCFSTLPQADTCMVRPETCHYDQGTCRDAQWGQAHCLIPHTIYLANSSGVKVGITRQYQQITRWMDQGAIQALPILTVYTRADAGRVEMALKQYVADKTNWRTMLKGDVPDVDLAAKARELLPHVPDSVKSDPMPLDADVAIRYPVRRHPLKVISFNFDKNPVVEGCLEGIKGQYLIFDHGVINIRKFGGYEVAFTDDEGL